MFSAGVWFYAIFFHLIIVQVQASFNLYYTDWISNNDENIFYHDCLRFNFLRENQIESESFFYCLSEFLFHLDFIIDKQIQNFTFIQLQHQQITSKQLFHWSAPIDLIEDYQIYLDHNDRSLENKRFFNCTLPKFGPQCQYQIPKEYKRFSTFYESIQAFYINQNGYVPTLTCYTHLQCDRGIELLCLDWTDICNGKIDCLNDGVDEKDCWQLEINECQKNEHRCRNGQCISKLFLETDIKIELDISNCIMLDIYPDMFDSKSTCLLSYEAGFKCADVIYHDKTVLTYSTVSSREMILFKILHSSNNTNSYSNRCWTVFTCLINAKQSTESSCNKFCQSNSCHAIIQSDCPSIIFYPTSPVLFGNIYIAYNKNHSQNWTSMSSLHIYLCYKTTDYDQFFINITKIYFNNFQCVHLSDFVDQKTFSYSTRQDIHLAILFQVNNKLINYHLIYNYTTEICNRSSMYQCRNSSKCISIHRLIDRINDCPQMDDENHIYLNTNNIINFLDKTHFKCSNSTKYLHRSLLGNSFCDCKDDPLLIDCDDEQLDRSYIENNILFQHICDGYTELLPIYTDNRYETDENECQQWPCNNIYTRCNGEWNCPTSEDEFACELISSSECSSNEYFCVSSSITNQIICLSHEKFNDGHIDCLGGMDELLCQRNIPLPIYKHLNYKYHYFYCSNQCLSIRSLCDGYNDCKNGDDEQFCTLSENLTLNFYSSENTRRSVCISSNVRNTQIYARINFKLPNMEKMKKKPKVMSSHLLSTWNRHRCHLGFPIHLSSNLQTSTCLCPPNYYGSQCQYQNQRISLALKFQALSDSVRTLFAIVILLIDNTTEEIIHSVEQFSFLSLTDCQTIFNIYLLYSTRPKHLNKEYRIHIDIYEKDIELKYRGSLLYSIQFPFLPVYRTVLIVPIPPSYYDSKTCFNKKCVHGRCIHYWNNSQNHTFCQCDQGWSGKYCQISQHCQCSSDSICIGKSSNNRSICICPKNRFGSRCYLINFLCDSNENSTCLNGGQCISDDNYLMSNRKFKCLCSNGYSGNRCEISDYKLNLSFQNDIIQSQTYLFIHFHRLLPYVPNQERELVVRSSTFRTIPIEIKPILIQWSQLFHLVFIELSQKKYYLAYVQMNHTSLLIINKTIISSDRCPHISELFNETFLRWHLIRRIKYYHLPCQNQSLNLSCFHDENHLCLCYDFYDKRLANCLQFDHNLTYNCLGRSECENDGQCLQDNPTCSTRSICICKPCFYGRRCQYRTDGYGLSLDPILGYSILPMKSFSQQQIIIKISFMLTIIFMITGLINGILSFITFKNKPIQKFGCGLYLLGSSIISIILTILFTLKFVFFLLTQMTILTNMLFLQIQCYILDFSIRICLNLDQWFSACIATERAITAIQGARFKRKTSLKIARWVIFSLIISVIATSLHDSINRDIIIENNENEDEYKIKRIWCIVRYSSHLQIYNSIVYTIHFFGPFLFNLISSIILIIKKSRQQQHLHSTETYLSIVQKQFQELKQILIAPIVLVFLAFPHLILTYIRTCLQTQNDIWLYLCGYFLSFIPSMLTFIIFVLPSKFYKSLFRQTIQKYRTLIRRHLHLNS